MTPNSQRNSHTSQVLLTQHKHKSTHGHVTTAHMRNFNQYSLSFIIQQTKVFNNPILDVFGYSGYSAELNAVVVTFRSTASIQNWVVNLDANEVTYPHCDGCLVHQGFYNGFLGVEGYIRQNVQALLSTYRGAKIMVTGFSLGSALAVFGALDLAMIFGKVD